MVTVGNAQALDYTWLGGTGYWNDANWSLAGFPNASTSNAFIDGGNLLNSVVNLNTSASIGNLGIDAGDALNIQNGGILRIWGGTITNNGTLTLNGTGNNTWLYMAADTTLTGTGSTVLGNNASNQIYGNGHTLNIGSGHTVSGGGSLGSYVALKVVNQGTAGQCRNGYAGGCQWRE